MSSKRKEVSEPNVDDDDAKRKQIISFDPKYHAPRPCLLVFYCQHANDPSDEEVKKQTFLYAVLDSNAWESNTVYDELSQNNWRGSPKHRKDDLVQWIDLFLFTKDDVDSEEEKEDAPALLLAKDDYYATNNVKLTTIPFEELRPLQLITIHVYV